MHHGGLQRQLTVDVPSRHSVATAPHQQRLIIDGTRKATEREVEVPRLLARGVTNLQIAAELDIAVESRIRVCKRGGLPDWWPRRVTVSTGFRCEPSVPDLRPHITDPKTGEGQEVEFFVAVLGASSFTYAEATATQRSQHFIASHVRAIEYWGDVPALFVPDQLRTGVSGPHRYEPEIQRTYEEMAEHYGAAVLPARPRSARDKAKVEVAVQISQRWILARLRNETFFSMGAFNERIWELLEDLNDRVMRRYGKSRRQLFAELDRPALRPLPSQRFVWGEWKNAGVNIDCHVEFQQYYDSVPFTLVRERVEVRSTAATIEAFYKGRRVASHQRSYVRGGFSTGSRSPMG